MKALSRTNQDMANVKVFGDKQMDKQMHRQIDARKNGQTDGPKTICLLFKLDNLRNFGK